MNPTIKVNEEFHKNGTLAYRETIKYITKEEEKFCENVRVDLEGNLWHRIGTQTKYHDNGVIAWVLNYEDNGKLVNEHIANKREDGSNVIY